MIKIANPLLDEKEEKAVFDVLRSGNISQGEKVFLFEKKFAEFINTNYAIAVSNGTAALHLALLAIGIKEGDEVITTAFSFIASSNAILYTGAKSVFVDIDSRTFNMDTELVEEKITKKTKAILPVHLYGLPTEMEKIMKLAKKYKLFVIEDAAQAHGSAINDIKAGGFGNIGCFSFYSTKNMTTGEGGMIVTKDAKLANKVRMLREHGMKERYNHEFLGFNFRMTDISAAIGIEQLKKLTVFNDIRRRNAQFLSKKLSNIPEIVIPYIPTGYTHVFHQYTVLVKKNRDKLAEYLKEHGVETMVYYPKPIYKQKFMEKMYPRLKLPNVERITSQVLSLPVHPLLTRDDLKKIVNLIDKFFS